MHIAEYLDQDATGIAELVRSGAVSPTEPAQCALALAEKLNPVIGAFAEFYPERATADFINRASHGPFWGVPFAIKDAVAHEDGQVMEMGSRLCAGLRAPGDTDLALRFKTAGLINLGRTKVPEFAFNISTEALLYGPAHNPWRQGYSTGGSSGGAAAAVAARILPIAHANDGGGSIRIPASCCGVVGLKPTRGRVPIGPEAGEGLGGLGIEHVVTRSVRDTAAALDWVAGPGVGDPYEIAQPEERYANVITRDPARLKIALWQVAPNGDAIDPRVAAALARVASQCEALGHDVEVVTPDIGLSWDAFMLANAQMWCVHIAHWVEALEAVTGRKATLDTVERTSLACVDYGRTMSGLDVMHAEDSFNIVSRAIGRLMTGYDLILSPTMPFLPHAHGVYDANAEGLDGLGWTAKIFKGSPFTPLFNVTGLPAISLPLGHDETEDLPIGIQFGAGFGREDRLLGIAAQLERAMPWAGRRPTLPYGI
ncbi:amidase [Parapedomonas caeni]